MNTVRNTARGLSIIELMIVVIALTALVAVAIPLFLGIRHGSNESAAIATMGKIHAAQAQFQMSAVIDVDGDGVGEFGYFRELSGKTGLRTDEQGTPGELIAEPLLPEEFKGATGADINRVTISGYEFYIYLPRENGHGTENPATGGFTHDHVDTDLAETTWCAYAVPVEYGGSGSRLFFVNQKGDLTSKDDADWHANWCGGQALALGGHWNSMTGAVAIGTKGRDHQVWTRVE